MVTKFDPGTEGYLFDGRVMDNGERRIRVEAPDKTAYIRTEMSHGQEGAWQNAHHHKGVRETYIVERGWVAVAELRNRRYSVRLYRVGEVFTTEPDIDHNVYMVEGAVIHTVKHGAPVGNPEKNGNDWYPAEERFDHWSKDLSIEEIELLGRVDTDVELFR